MSQFRRTEVDINVTLNQLLVVIAVGLASGLTSYQLLINDDFIKIFRGEFPTREIANHMHIATSGYAALTAGGVTAGISHGALAAGNAVRARLTTAYQARMNSAINTEGAPLLAMGDDLEAGRRPRPGARVTEIV